METYSLIFYEYVIKLVTRRRADSLMIISPKTDQFLKRAHWTLVASFPQIPDSSSTDPCRGLIMKVWVISNKPRDCEPPCLRVAAKSRLKCCPGAAIHHPGLETEYQDCPDPTSGHLALLRAPRARGNLCKYWSRLLLDFTETRNKELVSHSTKLYVAVSGDGERNSNSVWGILWIFILLPIYPVRGASTTVSSFFPRFNLISWASCLCEVI